MNDPDQILRGSSGTQVTFIVISSPHSADCLWARAGKGMQLLSGGIDSPVGGWMMAKRGMEIEAMHFLHNIHIPSERAKDKVISLVKILSAVLRQDIGPYSSVYRVPARSTTSALQDT